MEKSGFFNSVNKDRRYLAEDFAKYFSLFIDNGVFPQEADWLKVKTAGGMSVALSAGYAWINGYNYQNDSDKVFQIDVSDGVNKRIDAIMLRWSKTGREITSVYVKGNFSSDPVSPAPTRTADFYDLKVAEIYVRAGATQIETQDITDTRFNKSVCGIVAGVVDQIDTTDLFSQYGAEFQAFMKTIEGTLSGDVAGNLLNLINTHTSNSEVHVTEEEKIHKLAYSNSGSTHALTGLTSYSGVLSCVFSPTVNFAAGDAITVDGTAYTIQLSNGEAAEDNLFVSGASVPVVVDTAGKKVNFKAAGGQKLPAGTMDVLAILTQNGTFIVPQTGIYKITAIGHGGFGGDGAWGRDSYTLTGGGGAAGGIATVTKDLKKGESYTITVNDSQSSFGNLVTAIAGGNGFGINPGIGGSGSGDQVWNGGNGIIGNKISGGGGFVNGADGGSTSSQAPFGGAKGSPGKIAGFKNPPYNMVEDDSIRPYLLNDRNFGSIQNKYFGFGAGCGSSAAARTADGDWVQVITGHDTDIDYPMGANGAIFVEMVLE